MPRRAHPITLLLAVLMFLVSGVRAQQRSAATYRVTFQGTWTTAVTPGGIPSGAHFTTLIGGVHNSDVTFLREGGMASAGVELMAELGGTSILTNEVRAAEPNALSVIRGSGNIGPTGSSTINMVTLTTDHPRVTLLTMVAPSPDWFVGVFGRSLLDEQGGWLPSLVVNLYPWDAGTEDGSEFSLSNPATSPQGVITSLRGKGKFSNERIATLTFTRQSVNTAPSFSSDTSFVADENQTAAGTLIAADPDNGDMVTYAITGGADASKFDIGSTTGVLTFKTPPNYERAADAVSSDPLNEAGNNEYILTVTATGGTDDRAMTAEQTITVNVRNLDETGTVSFSQVGDSIRTKLSDPDGGVSGERWQWARFSDRSTGWVDISGATADRYSPSSDDEEMYLRATVSYNDAQGSGKQAQGVSTFEISPPDLRVDTLVSGLSIPWDIAFTPDGTMLFTQRGGVLSSRLVDGTVQTIDAEFGDLFARGETGLMAVAVDPDFISNRRLYTCQGHAGPEVQVIAWTINAAYSEATRVADPLVGGMPTAASGRHGGCRLRFGPEGYLWIATGDAAAGRVPQDLTSLGGKVLRVDASTGAGAPTNPFASSPRVYTYGHRNVQGLALRPGTSQMWSVEHGPSVDDEINLLTPGRNYGWDPVPGYNERVPMTDLVKFPDAVEAKWSSGSSTLATSGGIFLEGEQWGVWEGRLAVATLKDSKLRLFEFTPDGAFVSQVVVPELDGEFGRLRTPMVGPDGALYVTTSNGGGDRILRITPEVTTAPPAPPPDGDGPSVPDAPENLTAVGGDGLAVLRWNAPKNDGGAEITDYEYRNDRDNPWISTGSTNTTHTVTGLVSGVSYVFQVRAVNSIGKSLASNQAEVTPEVTGDQIHYFPHLAVGASWQTTITLINYFPEEVTCQTDFLSDQGSPLMVSFAGLGPVVSRIDVLPPRGSVHEETNVELNAPHVSGWARATCSRPVKASLLFRQHDSDGIPVAEAGVNATTIPASRFVTFAEQQEDKAGTGVAYANPSSTEALITFTAKDAAGQTLASENLRVSPGGHGAQNMAELFGLSSFRGSLEVTSTTPVVSLSLNAEAAPVFSSLPPGELDAAAQGPTTYYFPHLAVGESWQTTLTYINDSQEEVTCRTEFISDHGNPLLVSFPGRGMLDRRTDVLPPGGSVHEETDVDLSAPSAAGWAKAACTGPLKASLLFRRYDSQGMPMGEAGVNATAVPAKRFVTFAEQEEGKEGTGVAYANPSTTAAHITFTVRDEAGQVLAIVDRTVLPQGHEAQNMAILFGLGSFTGSLEVISTEPIVSLSINAEADPVFSSLPPGEVDASERESSGSSQTRR